MLINVLVGCVFIVLAGSALLMNVVVAMVSTKQHRTITESKSDLLVLSGLGENGHLRNLRGAEKISEVKRKEN